MMRKGLNKAGKYLTTIQFNLKKHFKILLRKFSYMKSL